MTQAAAFLVLQALVGSRGSSAVQLVYGDDRHRVALIVAIYPFMKRITYWPQIVLGLAFSWGALMGWAAAFGNLAWPAIVLYAGSIAWVIGYDTIYAHQDREDDALIGVKSTARLFGANTKPMLTLFYTLAVMLLGVAGYLAGGRMLFAFGLAGFAAHLAWQVRRLDIDDPDLCLRLFKSNREAGLFLYVAMLLDPVIGFSRACKIHQTLTKRFTAA